MLDSLIAFAAVQKGGHKLLAIGSGRFSPGSKLPGKVLSSLVPPPMKALGPNFNILFSDTHPDPINIGQQGYWPHFSLMGRSLLGDEGNDRTAHTFRPAALAFTLIENFSQSFKDAPGKGSQLSRRPGVIPLGLTIRHAVDNLSDGILSDTGKHISKAGDISSLFTIPYFSNIEQPCQPSWRWLAHTALPARGQVWRFCH